MRLFTLLLGLFGWAITSTGYSATTFYTDLSAFDSATLTTIVEEFESFSPKDTPLSSFSSNGISYTGFAGTPFPNVLVASPGYTNFGVPITTSSILTANGDEDFLVEFSTPITAIGFNTYLNDFGPANVSVFGVSGLLDTFGLVHDSASIGFLGISSTENITSLRWTTTNGRAINTGIDNIQTGYIVPIPAAFWLFSSGLFGLFGLIKIRRNC